MGQCANCGKIIGSYDAYCSRCLDILAKEAKRELEKNKKNNVKDVKLKWK